MWPRLLAGSPLNVPRRIEKDKRAFWKTAASRGLGSGHPRIRGLLHPACTSILPPSARYPPEPALNLGRSVGGPDYARIPTPTFLTAGQPEPKINNKPSAAATACRGRLRRNRDEDPGEDEGPRRRRKM